MQKLYAKIEVEGQGILAKPRSCPTIRNARLFVDPGQVYASEMYFFLVQLLWFSRKHGVNNVSACENFSKEIFRRVVLQ